MIGFYLIVGRFWVDARQRARTHYALTDRRVIIVSGIFSRSTQSLTVATLSNVTLTTTGSGKGTVFLGSMPPMNAWWGALNWPGLGQFAVPALELGDNAEEVYQKILAVQKAHHDAH